jgi:hypothetical protein
MSKPIWKPGENPMFSQDVAEALERLEREIGGGPNGQTLGILIGQLTAEIAALKQAVVRLENGAFGKLAEHAARLDELENKKIRFAGRMDVVLFLWTIISGSAVYILTKFSSQLAALKDLHIHSGPP